MSEFNDIIESVPKRKSKKKNPQKDDPPNIDSNHIMSRVAGVDDLSSMMADINSNYLIENKISESIGGLVSEESSYTPMEILGSYAVEKYGMYLAPISVIGYVYNHLDWKTFSKIADERKKKHDTINNCKTTDTVNVNNRKTTDTVNVNNCKTTDTLTVIQSI